jgi:hypothetical protein
MTEQATTHASTAATDPQNPPSKRKRIAGPLAIAIALVLGILGGLGHIHLRVRRTARRTCPTIPTPAPTATSCRRNFDSWVSSSHTNVATCNDCHLLARHAG